MKVHHYRALLMKCNGTASFHFGYSWIFQNIAECYYIHKISRILAIEFLQSMNDKRGSTTLWFCINVKVNVCSQECNVPWCMPWVVYRNIVWLISRICSSMAGQETEHMRTRVKIWPSYLLMKREAYINKVAFWQ